MRPGTKLKGSHKERTDEEASMTTTNNDQLQEENVFKEWEAKE